MAQSDTLTVILALKDTLSAAIGTPLKALNNLGAVFGDLQRSANLALFAIKGALILLGKEAVESAMHITRLSRITGIGTQTLQQYGAAANITGANFDRLSTGMKLLAEKAEKAAEGNKGFIELFNKVGLSVRDANGNVKDAESLFREFSTVIANTTNPTTKMALAVEFLGRSGEELLPMLNLGAEGLRKFGAAAEASGMVMSKETVVALDIMGKQLSALKTIAINMTGEWLAASGVTVPKIIDLFVQFSIVLTQIVAGWKIIFMSFVELTKLAGVTIGLVFDAIGNKLKEYLNVLISDAAPKINALLGVLTILHAIAPETAQAVAMAMAGMATATGNFDKEAIQKLPQAMADAWDQTQKVIKNKGKMIGEDAQASIATLKEKASSVQDYMQAIDTANKNLNTGVTGTVEDMYAKIHTFEGGFAEATKEFVRNAGDWKSAWMGVFNSMENGISSVLTKFITEGGKLKDFTKELFKSIEQSFVSMITKMLTQQALLQLMGVFGGGGQNSSPVQNMFGNSGSGGQNATGVVPQIIGGVAAFAPAGAGQLIGGGEQTASGGGLGGLGFASLAGLGFGAATAIEGVQHGNVTHSTVGGLAAGAALGTMVFPGIGTVIGAVVGAAAGFFAGNAAKNRQRKQEEEAQAAQAAQELAMRNQARILLAADIRGKYGGGLADISAVTDIGHIMSGGITDATLDEIGAQNVVNQGTEIGTGVNQISVGSPQITINATVAGSYDVQQLAQSLGIHLAASIRAAAAGSGI